MLFTASLVTYRHSLPDIRAVVDGVLESKCDKFYIVDNSASASLAAELSALNDSRIEYIPQDNRGFGAGHNIAITRAVAGDAKIHFIINPDIEFGVGTLENIAGFMGDHPEIGMIMPKIIKPDGELDHNCKLVPSPLDLISKRFLPDFLKRKRMHRFMMKDFDHDLILDVPYLCGCFLALNTEALAKCGAFDERFFMYPEDIDLTRRIFASGYRTIYYPEAEVIHRHEQASYKNRRMLKIHIVNMIRYFNKWGWIFDRERRKLNRRALELNSFRRKS